MSAPIHSSLLRAYHRGNESAARSLYAQTAPGLLIYARSILRDSALADDAVQSVFCKILALPGREVRRVESVRPWLVRLVRNEAISMQRSNARRCKRESAHAPAPPVRNSALGTNVAIDDLRRVVEQLNEPHREIIMLKYALELTFEQIAEVLEVNRNTAASRYRQALAQLRELMGTSAHSSNQAEVTSHA
jgi:RNA polymerase sigma-70 factor (ECF subfamily)